MTDNQELTLNDVEKRLSNLEKESLSRTEKLEEIAHILKKIERVLIGDLESDVVGLVSQVRDIKKEIQFVDAKTVLIENVATSLDKEFNKYKWMVRGIIIAIGVIISYSLKIWNLFKP